MRLSVQDAAKLLNVSSKTVYGWIREGTAPAHRINDQYRFNRAELLEWATARGMELSPDIFRDAENGPEPLPTLRQALEAGGLLHGVAGKDKVAVLRTIVDAMALPPGIDREFLFQVLLAREALGSTGIGDGIAIPHARNPIVLQEARPSITLCFLREPVDFGSLDGRPVTTLFVMISPTVRIHLHMLSRLGFVLRDRNLRAALLRQAPREDVLEALTRAEGALPAPARDA
jgi:PTS system nitrogen regulatory IIA component